MNGKHFNNNLLCSIDIETTGLDPTQHDIWQIAIIPLDYSFEILKDKKRKPFLLEIIPSRPENADPKAISREKLTNATLHGCDSYRAADLLVEWFDKLELPFNKRVYPLGQNYVFDRSFMIEWLGWKTYDLIFDYHYRDTMVLAQSINDIANWRGDEFPFPQVSLQALATRMKIERTRAHDATDDARVTAEVYQRLIQGAY